MSMINLQANKFVTCIRVPAVMPSVTITFLMFAFLATMSPSLHAGVIDATSLETILQSIEGESENDIAVIKKLICEASDGVDASDPKAIEATMDRVRKKMHGKTVGAVLLEAAILQSAKDSALEQKAKTIVREYRSRWRTRMAHFRSVEVGMSKEQLVTLLGAPDFQSNSKTAENYLYGCDAAYNEEQIWLLKIAVEITNGKVSNVKRMDSHVGIEDASLPKAMNSSTEPNATSASRPNSP